MFTVVHPVMFKVGAIVNEVDDASVGLPTFKCASLTDRMAEVL